MAVLFPDLVEEQLLGDAFGRYQEIMGYQSAAGGKRDLFGVNRLAAEYDFPFGLENLLAKLPPGHHYAVEELIYSHTLLPFYAPFIPPDRLATICDRMKSVGPGGISKIIGPSAHKTQRPIHLRYCPLCVNVDKAELGFCFWRRVHQAPGIYVCPKHATWLISSEVRARPGKSNHRRWIAAETGIKTIAPVRALDLNDSFHKLLIGLAEDSQWLLKQPNLAYGPRELLRRYTTFLYPMGLASITGQPKTQRIIEAVRAHFSDNILRELTCPLEGVERNWIWKLFEHKESTVPPLYHLLLIRFLDISIQEFFKSETHANIFGQEPWPCYNPLGGHKHGEKTIKSCEIRTEYSAKEERNTIVGIFTCHCGFQYKQDSRTKRALKNVYVKDVLVWPETWSKTFIQMWNDPKVKMREIMDLFRLNNRALRQQAKRLELAWPRVAERRGRIAKNSTRIQQSSTTPNSNAAFLQKRKEMRRKWRQARKKNPAATNTQLQKQFGCARVYRWLKKKDKKWLLLNVPPEVVTHPEHSPSELQALDFEISERLPQIADEIKQRISPTVRVTPAALFKAINKSGFTHRYSESLTQSWAVAHELTETYADWALRRIPYALQKLAAQNKSITWSSLVEAAYLRKYLEDPRLEKAIQDALASVSGTLVASRSPDHEDPSS